MSEHFNMTVDGLADSLFGDDANIDDFRTFCDGLEDEEEKSFIKAIEEALLIEDPWADWEVSEHYSVTSTLFIIEFVPKITFTCFLLLFLYFL